MAGAIRRLAEPRGLCAGCLGWIDAAGSCELAMTIRGVELRGIGTGGEVRALVGSGGGITIDSDPDAELGEQRLKAEAILRALGSR